MPPTIKASVVRAALNCETQKPEIPEGFAELTPGDVIGTDDQIWLWGKGPWKYVGGSIIGTRYQRPTAETESHWTIIRERNT